VIEMDARLHGDMSLNVRVGGEDSGTELEALLVDHEQTERRASALRVALGGLAARERRVFEARRLTECPVTLDRLAHELSISSERVRQIEMRAFAKVKRAVMLAAQDAPRGTACSV